MWDFQPIKFAPPTVPANNGTATLFDSTTMLPLVSLQALGIGRVKLAFPNLSQASATSGLIGYISGDKGVSWQQYTFAPSGGTAVLPATVAAATGTDCSAFDVYVGPYADVKITLTAGATAPSDATWAQMTITADQGNVHSGA